MRGDRMRELRTSKGLTAEKLAELLNISHKQIWRYESGHTDPTAKVLARMAQVFQVSADYLLGITDNQDAADLTTREILVLSAMRRNEPINAIRYIVEAV